jgi:hypothetical protein
VALDGTVDGFISVWAPLVVVSVGIESVLDGCLGRKPWPACLLVLMAATL